MPRPPRPFQLLEINLISAQDLTAASKSMRTFAVAWINPQRKLTTRVDQNGHTNPTWNEKFVFRVDDDFLNDDTSKIMIEIYPSAWLGDVLVVTAAIVVSNINSSSKMRFMAIQLRRQSGRPQGILNLGIGLLDNTMKSMPLYSELSASTVGLWDIVEAKGTKKTSSKDGKNNNNNKVMVLKRSQSERTTTDSALSKSVGGNNFTKRPPGSICIGSSIVNGSEVSSVQRSVAATPKSRTPKLSETPTKAVSNPNGNGSMVNGSLCSDVGPSPSVVAAAIAKGIYSLPHGCAAQTESGSSLMDEWVDEDSVEGLKTKIERWRTEMPPLYDTKKSSHHPNNMKLLPPSSHRNTTGRKERRSRSGAGKGLFSCFAFGCEISISCGGKYKSKKKKSGKVHLDQSELTYTGTDDSYVR